MFAQQAPIFSKKFQYARDIFLHQTKDVFSQEHGEIPRSLLTNINEDRPAGLAHALDQSMTWGLAEMNDALKNFNAYRETYLGKIKNEIEAQIKKGVIPEKDKGKILALWTAYGDKLKHLGEEFHHEWDEIKAKREHDAKEEAAKHHAEEGAAKAGVLKVRRALEQYGEIDAQFAKAIHVEKEHLSAIEHLVAEVESAAHGGGHDLGPKIKEIHALLTRAREESTRMWEQHVHWQQQGAGKGLDALLKANGLDPSDLDRHDLAALTELAHKLAEEAKEVAADYETTIPVNLRALGMRLQTIETRLPKGEKGEKGE